MTFVTLIRFWELAVLLLTISCSLSAQSILAELQLQHDPGKRSDMALNFATESFDTARDLYAKGEIQKGDAALENMTSALNSCVDSLAVMNKARLYKKAELKVAYLQRRMTSLKEEVDVQQRGWAEFTARKLEEIHDKVLAGVMRK
jgi:hypothetical protein